MLPQLKKVERGEAHGRMKEQRQEDYQGGQFDQVARQAARLAIRRLKLDDTTRTWATLKGIITEAIEQSHQG